jgi:flagellar biosynthesis protein FlhA
MGLAGLMAFMARTFKDTEGTDALAAAQGTTPAKPGAKGAAATPGKPGEAAPAGAVSAPATEDVRKLTEVDIFSIEIGYGLLPLAEARSGGDLLARVTGVRKTLAREKGLVVPPVSVRDNLELEANDYRFLLRGTPVARGTILPGRLLAMNVAGSTIRLRGQPTREPVFNLDATWIDEGERKTAEMNNYTVVDPSSVLITHLSETLKANSHHLLARQDVQSLVDHLKTSHAALIAELLPDLVTLGVIQRVLQNLLREGVAILNLPLILEGIADFASLSKNPDDLSELVRRRLGLYFVPELESRPGVLRALTLDPRLEQFLGTKVHRSPTDVGLSLDPATGRHLIDELNRRVAQLTSQGAAAVLVVSTETRLPIKRFLEPSFPRLTVLAFQELPSSTEIENAGLVPLPAHLMPQPIKAAA